MLLLVLLSFWVRTQKDQQTAVMICVQGAYKGTSCAMPFLDVQKKLGISLDRHFVFQSVEQPFKIPSRCHAFEKEWIECAHGIGATRAKKECKIEFEDFEECYLRYKTMKRLGQIKRQRDKLVKEGKYTPPPHHMGQEEPRP